MISRGPVPAWLDNTGPDADVVISTRIRLARNLTGHQFPKMASLLERKGVFEEITETFRTLAGFDNYDFLNFYGMPRLQQQLLVEERVASPDLLRIDGDRGVISGDAHRVNIMVNEEDHLRMQCIDSGYRPKHVWEAVDRIDNGIGERLRFAFDARRGFLTSCPTNSGTGLRMSFLLHLPGLVLTKTVDQVLLGASQLGVSTRGFFGERSEVIGGFFQLSNHATLGAREEEFLDGTQSVVRKIIDFERAARGKVLANAKLELEDRVFRAYGIMLHARTLEVDEFLGLSSALRTGIACGLFDVLTIGELNSMMLSILPAHMQALAGRHMNDDEMVVERAALVRKIFAERN